jgi:hypothetical protein
MKAGACASSLPHGFLPVILPVILPVFPVRPSRFGPG